MLNGVPDSANYWSGIVNISGASGVLISPYWVLTARHIFGTSSSFDQTVKCGPIANQPCRLGGEAEHTFATSGQVFFRTATDPPPYGECHLDLAAFRLDKPVPRSIARPIRPPLLQGDAPCSDETLFVYGGYGDANVDDNTSCPNNSTAGRDTNIDIWTREQQGDSGLIFERDDWFLNTCSDYDGPTSGDSGGALIEVSNKEPLCGIIHGNTLDGPNLRLSCAAAIDKDYLPGLGNVNWLLSLQSPNTAQPGFLFSIVDAKGDFDGDCENYRKECQSYSNCWVGEVDPDGDGVLHHCDNCSRIYNPEQVAGTTGDDTDGDGYGDSCDLCAGSEPDQAADCNREASVANAWPTLAEPPLIAPPKSSAEMSQEISKLKANIKPDVCDPVGCPKHARSKGGLPLPEIVPCDSNGEPQDCNCPPAWFGWSCEWEVDANKLELRPRIEPGAGDPVGTSVTLGMRWCQCDPLEPLGSPAQRLSCRDTCPMTPTAYGGNPAWMPIRTTPSLFNPVWTDGEEVATQLEPYSEQSAQVLRYWDIRPLAEAVGEITHVSGDPSRPVNSWTVHGITMSKIVAVNGQPVGTQYKPEYYERSMTFGQGHAFVKLKEIDPNASYAQLAADDWFSTIFCPECPVDFTFLGMAVSNPPVFATPETLQWPFQPADSLASTYEQALAGEVEIIEASEMLRILGEKTPPGQSILRAVAFDAEAGWVTTALESPDIVELPRPYARDPGGEAPQVIGNEGFALSSISRSLVMVGGTSDGSPDGEPQSSGWLLDVESNSWAELRHEDEAFEDLPRGTFGTVFRLADRHVYLAATGADSRRFLWRYLPRVRMDMIAELPELWATYERSWLVVGEGGDLLFIGSSDAPADSLLARFTVFPDGTLRFEGLTHMPSTIIARPMATRHAIHAVVAAEPARLEVIDLSELREQPAGETPTIL